jgi:hypothetical protein
VKHRIVSIAISTLLSLFGAGALLFAMGIAPLRTAAARAARPASMPHESGGPFLACRECHRAEGSAAGLPVTHRRFTVATCTTCHPSSVSGL